MSGPLFCDGERQLRPPYRYLGAGDAALNVNGCFPETALQHFEMANGRKGPIPLKNSRHRYFRQFSRKPFP